ncbi:MAG: hypothetical protein J7M19_04685 [Planctomycetes bacterium]|nr:hypothetical protein [Planctomycetota bacterium]
MSQEFTDLRPMGIGEILDRSIQLYRSNFSTFFGILLVVYVLMFVVNQPLLILQRGFQSTEVGDPAQVGVKVILSMAFSLMTILVALVITPLGQGALTLAVSQRFLGRRISTVEAYRGIVRRLPTLIWAGLLVAIVVGLGFMLFLIPGIYFYFCFLLTTVVVVLEEKKATAAMGRSKELMRVKTEKGFWSFRSNSSKAAIILLIMFALNMAVSFIMTIPTLAVQYYYSNGQVFTPEAMAAVPVAVELALGALQTLLGAAVAPIFTIPLVLLYYDIRIRFEGFDLEMMAQSLSQTPAASEVGLDNP